LLLKVQVVNILIGVTFFYLAPVAIAPKANLVIFFVISTLALLIWRMVMFPVVSSTRKQNAIVIGRGEDIEDLYKEMNENQRYGLIFKERVIPGVTTDETVKLINGAVKRTNTSVIVADFHDRVVESAMPFLYSMVFSGIQIIDASKMYETIFDRIPLSMVGERWLVENSGTSLGNRRIYDSLKRVIDIVLSFVGGIFSLLFYPFVYIAIKIEDHGPIFITQERVGKNGKPVRIIKFRSMSGNDEGKYGKEGTTTNVVTRVGKVLRNSRIDELPQFWSVLKGEMSLVGPRSELPALTDIYEKDIPYYNARHLVKPGLSGWAQIYHENHPHHSIDTEDTRDKLSYDLYYIKNRSLALDAKIVMRTIQILMKRVGR
jgi:lipopolysaccharide/colanic/teichoic acid biosynthesis glycosyltransferase